MNIPLHRLRFDFDLVLFELLVLLSSREGFGGVSLYRRIHVTRPVSPVLCGLVLGYLVYGSLALIIFFRAINKISSCFNITGVQKSYSLSIL